MRELNLTREVHWFEGGDDMFVWCFVRFFLLLGGQFFKGLILLPWSRCALFWLNLETSVAGVLTKGFSLAILEGIWVIKPVQIKRYFWVSDKWIKTRL